MLTIKMKRIKWHGEGEGAGAAGDAGTSGAGGTGDAGGTPAPKTFTQDEVNSFLASEKRKHTQELQVLQDALKGKGSNDNDVAARLAEISKTHDSAIQVMKDEHTKQLSKLDGMTKAQMAKYTALEQEYHATLVTASLSSAASKFNAYNPAQIMSMFGPSAKVADEIREGKVTGKKIVTVSLPDVNDSSKTLTLPAEEAIKYMSENPKQYGNLFKTHLEGVDFGESKGAGPVDYNSDFETFRKKRSNSHG